MGLHVLKGKIEKARGWLMEGVRAGSSERPGRGLCWKEVFQGSCASGSREPKTPMLYMSSMMTAPSSFLRELIGPDHFGDCPSIPCPSISPPLLLSFDGLRRPFHLSVSALLSCFCFFGPDWCLRLL